MRNNQGSNFIRLKIGLILKPSPKICGPFMILKKVGQVFHKIELPFDPKVNGVFQSHKPKKHLMITTTDPPSWS